MSDQSNDPAPRAGGLPPWLEDAERVDLALYAAIARTPTPALDRAMSRVSRAADYSKISIAAAGLLAATGGGSGRRAATMGLASLGAAAALFNLVAKPLSRRSRPDRVAGEVPIARHVRMPTSTSFRPDTRQAHSPSRPASAGSCRKPRSRFTPSPRSSATRGSTPAFTIPATWSPAPSRERSSPSS